MMAPYSLSTEDFMIERPLLITDIPPARLAVPLCEHVPMGWTADMPAGMCQLAAAVKL